MRDSRIPGRQSDNKDRVRKRQEIASVTGRACSLARLVNRTLSRACASSWIANPKSSPKESHVVDFCSLLPFVWLYDGFPVARLSSQYFSMECCGGPPNG